MKILLLLMINHTILSKYETVKCNFTFSAKTDKQDLQNDKIDVKHINGSEKAIKVDFTCQNEKDKKTV